MTTFAALHAHMRICDYRHDLVDALALPQPLVSQHLRILRAAELVVGSRRGREVVYSLRDEHIAHIVRDAVQHVGEPGTAEGAIA